MAEIQAETRGSRPCFYHRARNAKARGRSVRRRVADEEEVHVALAARGRQDGAQRIGRAGQHLDRGLHAEFRKGLGARPADEDARRRPGGQFGGGKGQLILEDPENPLTCGIEIRVQPPGKQVKTITLLSGGEKAFVATALYFSILKVRPTPFCLLDEIDAALDDRNVERFASYLHNLSRKTQFIVITHRRGTMEAADVLYGVTMQEQGVSKLLRLDLNQMEEYLGIVE